MPVITNIVQQKKNKKFYSIYVDGEFKFSLPENDLSFLGLREDQVIPKEKLDFFVQKYALQKARDYAYSLISKKAYSENSLREKLQNKNYPNEIIEKIIDELKEFNYINDKELIYEYAKSKIQLKPMGKYRLKSELYNKKFDEILIKECIEKIYQKYDEKSLAERAVKEHFKNMPEKIDENFLHKINNFLLSRGFSYETIQDVILSVKKSNKNKPNE